MAAKSISRIHASILSKTKYHNFSWIRSLCLEALRDFDNNEKESKVQNAVLGKFSSRIHLSSLLSPISTQPADFRVEVVDTDTWQVSSGLVEACRGVDKTVRKQCSIAEPVDEKESILVPIRDEPDFDDLEDMRVRGNLFYKVDKDSREFEESDFDFHRKKSSKKIMQDSREKEKSKEEPSSRRRKEKMNLNSSSKVQEPLKLMMRKSSIDELDGSYAGKKQRTPTFNELTAPYHEPFCLDIYISKSSVRACIVHRVTSKVVSVAHSISKDLKFDLSSTKNYTACVTVGGILAQRALADDIHDVVYTPRKGEKLEGKLQAVLQAIIDHGINVKVKIKKRKFRKVLPSSK